MSNLHNLRILVVEDESLIAMMLEDILVELGCVVVGPAGRLNDALDLVHRVEVDAAILDVNIHGEQSFPIAAALDQQGTRYIFATGYGSDGVKDQFSNAPVLQKPYSLRQIATALMSILPVE